MTPLKIAEERVPGALQMSGGNALPKPFEIVILRRRPTGADDAARRAVQRPGRSPA